MRLLGKSGLDEVGKRADTGEVVVRIDPRYFRPTEVDQLLGDASKARKKLRLEACFIFRCN